MSVNLQAKEQIEDGLQDWDPAKDDKAEVSCPPARALSRLLVLLHSQVEFVPLKPAPALTSTGRQPLLCGHSLALVQ